eukprot:g223.t1
MRDMPITMDERDDTVQLEGWLALRAGSARARPVRRYCVLLNSLLRLFEEREHAKRMKGKVQEFVVLGAQECDAREFDGFVFSTTSGDVRYCEAESEMDKNRWAAAIRRAVELDLEHGGRAQDRGLESLSGRRGSYDTLRRFPPPKVPPQPRSVPAGLGAVAAAGAHKAEGAADAAAAKASPASAGADWVHVETTDGGGVALHPPVAAALGVGPLGAQAMAALARAEGQCHIPLPQYGVAEPVRVCTDCFYAQTLLSYLQSLHGPPGGKFSLETAPFKMTAEMLDVLGGGNNIIFSEFRMMMVQGFLALQSDIVFDWI